MLYKFN